MSDIETGLYVIDDDFRIVAYNEAGKAMYRELEVGGVCHKVLMGLDSPCSTCPVTLKTKGRHVYFDARQGRYVSVDASSLELPGHGMCHVLSFRTELQDDDNDELRSLLENTRTQLKIVNALSRNFLNVYLIDLDEDTARILKLDGFVTEGLDKFDRATKYPYEEIVRRYTEQRVHPEDRERFAYEMGCKNVIAQLEDKNEYTGHYRILVDGQIHYFEFRFIVLDEEDAAGRHRVVSGFQNIDAIVEQEAANRQVLADALAAAEHSNRAKTTFLNNMSHDIRTPMNAIIGFTTLAATHIDNKDQVANYLKKIQTSSRHLLSLINDVLDMSRIESGKMRIEETEVSLASVMHDLKVIVQADVSAKRLDFFIDTVDITDEVVCCDRLRLNQVLLNLLSNAVKFTEPGGIVSVRVAQKAGAPTGFADYEFRVKDSGIGMSPEFLSHVFEAFERERNSTVSGTQGTGLGMAITKNIVDLMGGTIDVDSIEGKGTEFVVRLRFKTPATTHEPVVIKELQGLRALVADDSLDTCTNVAKMLHQIGMRPDWTTSGKEAVHRAAFALEQADEYYAYIIDWLMPDMNGIECVRRIRAVIGDSKPIIILTAYDWSDIEEEAREAGVTAFCSKPLFMSELRELLEKPFGAEEAKKAEGSKADFSGKRALLVEDNELNREIAAEILRSTGLSVSMACNGAAAVKDVEDNPGDFFDIVLMDIQMPIMDGYEATRCIRSISNRRKAHLPIYAMTANTFDEDKHRAEEAGMDGHISKPIEAAVLIKTLEEVLGTTEA